MADFNRTPHAERGATAHENSRGGSHAAGASGAAARPAIFRTTDPSREWSLPPRASTRALIHEARRIPGFSLFDFLHAYVYARWPYLYIGIGTGEHRLTPVFRWVARWAGRLLPRRSESGLSSSGEKVTFADTYHGKVVTLESATKLVTVDREVELRNLEHVIPYALARDIIMKNPDHIVVLECPCRAGRAHPCLPLDVCLIIGEPFASFVAEHHGRRSRWISSEEAIAILRAEHERGHVSHAFFKDAMLGRFYAICNCCACCCGAMQAMRNGVPMLASSGYVSRVDAGLCAGCGVCVEHCQFGAITLTNSHSVVDAGLCMGCGVCISKCPEGALSLQRVPDRGQPLEIQELIAQASQGTKR